MKIILDTNFLVYCAKNKLDYKEEIEYLIKEGFELVVPEQVIEELKMISKKPKIKNSGFLKPQNWNFHNIRSIHKKANSNFDGAQEPRYAHQTSARRFLTLRNPKFRKTTGRDRDAANLALQLLDFNKVQIVKTQGKNVDDAIINLANQEKKNIVCTLDREMRNILERVILINKFKRLMLTK